VRSEFFPSCCHGLNQMGRGKQKIRQFIIYVFDLLHLDGKELNWGMRFVERKGCLKVLVGRRAPAEVTYFPGNIHSAFGPRRGVLSEMRRAVFGRGWWPSRKDSLYTNLDGGRRPGEIQVGGHEQSWEFWSLGKDNTPPMDPPFFLFLFPFFFFSLFFRGRFWWGYYEQGS